MTTTSPSALPLQWYKAIASFCLVLCTMPLGHATMKLMEKFISADTLPFYGFALGFIGFLIVIVGVFVKGDTRQTLCGLIGGLLFWTGWVEFLFQYYANRYHVPSDLSFATGAVTKPEYLILSATFGLWMMVMLLYIFCTRTGCNFLNWCQTQCFRSKKRTIVARPMTRHTAIVTFMELNMILWTSYLLLMFCYDPRFLGDNSPITFAVAIGCFIGSFFIFAKQLRIASWGANIRMSIATVIVFWTPIEVMGRNNFLKEIWLEPMHYLTEMIIILFAFLVLIGYIVIRAQKNKA